MLRGGTFYTSVKCPGETLCTSVECPGGHSIRGDTLHSDTGPTMAAITGPGPTMAAIISPPSADHFWQWGTSYGSHNWSGGTATDGPGPSVAAIIGPPAPVMDRTNYAVTGRLLMTYASTRFFLH